ncbi:MAG: helix-turn-helix domain-containing protein [Chloroflexota bacterium]
MSEQKPEEWLTLSAAAKYLNVHATTLRRWADQDQIKFILTPGGHRRFSITDLKQFLNVDKSSKRKRGMEKTWAERAIVDTRQGISQQGNPSWLAHVDDAMRQKYRLMGQQLMGLTLQFISQPDEDESLLDQAHELGEAYGFAGQKMQMPLTDALQAAMFFRDTLIETAMQLPGNTNIKPEANLRLLKRINTLLNTVHLAIAGVYDANQSTHLPGH